MENPEIGSKRYTSYIPYYGWFLFSHESTLKSTSLTIMRLQFSHESTKGKKGDIHLQRSLPQNGENFEIIFSIFCLKIKSKLQWKQVQ